MRKGTVLVTDTRLAFIDPFDRMLKTYMFEHMISLQKKYYRTTAINRILCKALLLFGFILLLITLIIDLLDNDSRGFLLVYIPAILSLIVGLLVWRDMRPKYKIEWTMRDGSKDKIATEPLLREWLRNSKNREAFMDELAQAMNEALSGKAWWPANQGTHARGNNPIVSKTLGAPDQFTQPHNQSRAEGSGHGEKRHLKLVTENYE